MALTETGAAGAETVRKVVPRPRRRALRDDQVFEIRRMYGTPPRHSGRRPQGTVTIRSLAELYSVSADTIRHAVLGKGAYRSLAR